MAPASEPSHPEFAAVAELLGRRPQSDFVVVARDATGVPVVLRNAPLQHDGRPMPTLYWLEIPPADIAAAHARYAAERDALLPDGHAGPRPSGGVAGTREGVKCLHAHYAYHLAGGDDPVGRWVAARLAEES